MLSRFTPDEDHRDRQEHRTPTDATSSTATDRDGAPAATTDTRLHDRHRRLTDSVHRDRDHDRRPLPTAGARRSRVLLAPSGTGHTDGERRQADSKPDATELGPTTARPYCAAPWCWRPGALVELKDDGRDPVVLCSVHRRDYFGVSS